MVGGQPRAPGAARRRRASLAGGGGGAAREPPPREGGGGAPYRGVVLPRSVPLPSLGGQHCGRHWRHSGHGGHGPHTAPVRCPVPPPGVARASFLHAGAGLPVCRDPRGSTQWGGAGARGVGVQLRPPPGVTVPSGAGGTPPQPRGGWRAGAPMARRPGGAVGGRGEGGARSCSRHPPALGGGQWPPSPSPFFSGAPPLGVHVQPGLPGGRGRQTRPGRPPVGQCGGKGEERSPRHGMLPGLPQAGTKAGCFISAFLGAAVPLRPTAPAVSRRLAAGNAGVSGWSTGGAWGAGLRLPRLWRPSLGCSTPPRGMRGRRLSGLPPAAHGLGGGGGVGGRVVSRSPLLVPWPRPPMAAGGRPGGSGPGGPAADWDSDSKKKHHFRNQRPRNRGGTKIFTSIWYNLIFLVLSGGLYTR